MDHHCEHEVSAPFLLTLPTGETFVLTRAEFAATINQVPPFPMTMDIKTAVKASDREVAPMSPIALRPRTTIVELDGSPETESISHRLPLALPELFIASPSRRESRREASCASYTQADILTVDELLARDGPCSPASPERIPPALGERRPSRVSLLMNSKVYNEYGELIDAVDAQKVPEPSDLNTTGWLRLIAKAYRHEFRERQREVIVGYLAETEKNPGVSSSMVDSLPRERLSLWGVRNTPTRLTPQSGDGGCGPLVHSGPLRVLEIGCGDGTWCFKVKEEQPDWIVEGIDDTDHWLCVRPDLNLKDFMEPARTSTISKTADDYFSKVHLTQEHPEFTVRDINNLTSHKNPIPNNLYNLIRGRGIFNRVDSYKSMLEECRLILKPDGVVEFIEIDPRPRRKKDVKEQLLRQDDHKSGIETHWTDKIADRFINPLDAELDTETDGWTSRVEARLKANLRPTDGVPAVHLKSWLEGNGFWDVKQDIIRLPVGGPTPSGQLLKDFLLYQVNVENAIPKLEEELPVVNTTDFESGEYHLNLHFVTGRKPKDPRPGDLLANGTQQSMTGLLTDVLSPHNSKKYSQWQRLDFDGRLSGSIPSVEDLRILPGAPENIRTLNIPERSEAGLYPILGADAMDDGFWCYLRTLCWRPEPEEMAKKILARMKDRLHC